MKAKELSCKDLMVWDWVKPKNVDASFRVGLIGVDSVWNDTDTHEWDYDELEPIPIIPEILKNNGFDGGEYKNYCGHVFYLHVEGFREIGLTMGYKDNILWCERINQNYPNSIGDKYVIHHLDYVHELQHALRLCGIDKNIEL